MNIQKECQRLEVWQVWHVCQGWKWQYQCPPSEGVGGSVVLFILMVLVEGYFNFNIQLRIENNELIPMNEFMG